MNLFGALLIGVGALAIWILGPQSAPPHMARPVDHRRRLSRLELLPRRSSSRQKPPIAPRHHAIMSSLDPGARDFSEQSQYASVAGS